MLCDLGLCMQFCMKKETQREAEGEERERTREKKRKKDSCPCPLGSGGKSIVVSSSLWGFTVDAGSIQPTASTKPARYPRPKRKTEEEKAKKKETPKREFAWPLLLDSFPASPVCSSASAVWIEQTVPPHILTVLTSFLFLSLPLPEHPSFFEKKAYFPLLLAPRARQGKPTSSFFPSRFFLPRFSLWMLIPTPRRGDEKVFFFPASFLRSRSASFSLSLARFPSVFSESLLSVHFYFFQLLILPRY